MKKRGKILSALVASTMLVGSMIITPVKAESAKPFLMNGDNYSTLKESIEKAPNRKVTTIELTDNVTLEALDNAIVVSGKPIILDMNGYSVQSSQECEGRWITVNKNASFTIVDGGTINFADNPKVFGPIDNYGTLEVNDLTYIGTTESNSTGIWNRANGTATFNNVKMSGAATAIQTAEGSTTYINSGEYDSSWYAVIDNAGKMEINGGTFTNTSCSSCDNAHWGYTLRNKINGNLTFNNGTVYGVQGGLAIVGGTATVEGGHFETRACQNHPTGDTAFYALYITGEGDSEPKAIINGGEFIAVSKEAVSIGNYNDGGINLPAHIEIHGGLFTTKGIADVIKRSLPTGDAFIDGGTFNKQVKSEFILSGYEQIQDTTGTYTVVKTGE